MKDKIEIMLNLQVEANEITHPEWDKQGLEWYRAIYMELMELIDHVGWKWWKKQKPDTEQVALEVVDIWHFGMSIDLEHNSAPMEQLPTYFSTLMSNEREESRYSLIEIAENFAAYIITEKRSFPVWMFRDLMAAVGMTFDDLYKLYVGKNVLNKFRQANGYADGSYVKIWGELEDNQVLTEILKTLDPDSTEFQDAIKSALEIAYKPFKA